MEVIVPLILGFLVVFAIVVVVASRMFSATVKHMVGDRHAALEEIRRTGRVPELWRPRKERRGDPSGADRPAEGLDRSGGPVPRKYVKKLEGLQRYLRTTSLVEDEDVRERTLRRLEEVHERWEQGGSW